MMTRIETPIDAGGVDLAAGCATHGGVGLEELLGADHSAVGAHQLLQDSELLTAEHHGPLVPGHLLPAQRPHPCHQVGERERFAQVVVRTEPRAWWLRRSSPWGSLSEEAWHRPAPRAATTAPTTWP